MTDLYLVRHGGTEWSRTEQHISVTNLLLTDNGREEARALSSWLDPKDFGPVLALPRQRAQETARLARFHDFEVEEDLVEWFYGDYERVTSEEVQKTVPD